MTKRLARVLSILAVTLLALGLRLDAVKKLPIDYDEDDYLRAGQIYATGMQQGDWSVFTRENYRTEHPPLTKIADALAIVGLPPAREIPDRPTTANPASSLPQPHLTFARLMQAAFGTLAVFAVALINPIAGLFLAIDTWTIKYTSQVMLEALPALTSLLTVMFYLKSKRRFNKWSLLSAIMLGLTASSKYTYALVGVVVAAYWLWDTRPGREGETGRSVWKWLTPIVGWGVIALIVFFISDPYLWPDPINRLIDSVAYHSRYATTATEVAEANFPIWQPLVWLSESVPYHPGLFTFMLDAAIFLLAILGLRRLWRTHRLYALWLIVAVAFLFYWPTKWPQYVLILTVPLSLAASEGLHGNVLEPIGRWITAHRSKRWQRPTAASIKLAWRQTRTAAPWLLPGLITLGVIALFPLIFQLAMSLTDLSSRSLRDGMRGGVWRAVGEGLTGQAPTVPMTLFDNRAATQVNYAGSQLLLQLIGGAGADILVFNILWTAMVVALQAALGIAVALMLNRRGVRFKGWWRTLFILPWAIPEFVGALMWSQVFEPTNGWISLYTGAEFQWQSNPAAALAIMLVAGLWIGWPVMMLAATAGLKMIPPEVNDAAAIDGASAWRTFRSITWPLLLPVLAPVLIIRTIFAFNQFYLFYVMQPPFPIYTLSTISFFFFDATSGFGGQFAVSAALNVFTVIVLFVLISWFTRRTQAAELAYA
ncbi:MAG: ABC transporter permease subunit [Chloroflexi bacterium]|nr:ABC transporter permease subunit [Chloroflexota bacterium]